MPPKRELTVADDGLATPDVGPWAEDKYRLLWTYADMFSTSMKGKWDQRVYVDLFSGAGRSRIRGTTRIVLASPLLALAVNNPFDRYIFCEKDPGLLDALRTRSVSYRRVVDFVSGDVNDEVSSILAMMQGYRPGSRVLAFCFVDPYALENLRFSTIESLAARYMDFLVLVPSGMDAQRNEGPLLRPDNRVLDDFLGNPDWRDEWEAQRTQLGRSFETFVAWAFGESMKRLNYVFGGFEKAKLIRSTEKNLALYRLAFFSRNGRGGEFWSEALKYSFDQGELF